MTYVRKMCRRSRQRAGTTELWGVRKCEEIMHGVELYALPLTTCPDSREAPVVGAPNKRTEGGNRKTA